MSIATLSAVSSLPSFAVAAERFPAPPSTTQAFLREQRAQLSEARDRLSESQRAPTIRPPADSDDDAQVTGTQAAGTQAAGTRARDTQAKGVDLTV